MCLSVYLLLHILSIKLLTYVLHTRYSMLFHFILRFSSETRERNKQIHSDWKQKCVLSCFFRCISQGLKTKYQISLFGPFCCNQIFPYNALFDVPFYLSIFIRNTWKKYLNKFIQIENKNVSHLVSFVASARDKELDTKFLCFDLCFDDPFYP